MLYMISTKSVQFWNNENTIDDFTRESFTKKEVKTAIDKLNVGKAPGHDGIMKEQILACGDKLIDILFMCFKWILILEYIPENFRRGIQIPLYKGKNASALDPNNYRGITLLSTFNKVFEILLWSRLEEWWCENQVVSATQGACKKGVSSVHTAMLLQETIATELERNDKLFGLIPRREQSF